MAETRYAVVAVGLSTRQKLGMMARALEEAATLPPDDNPLFQSYHYTIPHELAEQLVPGQLLWVPFGSDTRQALLLGFADEAPVPHLRPIEALAQAEPFLQPYQIALARWLSHRYVAPLWDTLLLLLPPGVLQSTERVLRRTGRAVAAPLPREGRRALAWLEGQGGETTLKLLAEVLGSEAAARRATAALLAAGLLRDTTIFKPPGVRPRRERFVALAPLDEGEQQRRFRALGRRSNEADALDALAEAGGTLPLARLLAEAAVSEATVRALVEKGQAAWLPGTFVQRAWPDEPPPLSEAQQAALGWVERWPDDEPLTLRDLREAAIAPTTIQGLAARGCLLLHDQGAERVRLQVPPYRVAGLVDELRGSSAYRAVLDVLRHSPSELTPSELYEASGASATPLNKLAEAGLIEVEVREVLRNPLAERRFAPTVPPPFTPEQAAVWAALERTIARPDAAHSPGSVFLLHGVTGSGKTEIYLRAVAETLAQGKQAIVLVPEIALTPQTIARFGSRFGELIALQHSQLSQGERFDEWRRLRDGRAQIAIGSRSALFAPLPNLGLIVIDEEHEWSYKQGHLPGYRFPQYHARDVAERLVALTGATVLLGSATPALESYQRAEQGRYRLLEMGQRVPFGGDGSPTQPAAALPPVQVVDMRQELRAGNHSIFSRALQRALDDTMAAQQQAILFLNRRGAHSFVMCRDCGWVRECERCDVPMSSHAGLDFLICHQCSATAPIPRGCPHCLSPRVKHFGVGTQQVEAAVQALLPAARVMRWDGDTARGKGAHERLMARFAGGGADVLVGTQMIAKGLDLPLVTLVGIISADTALHLPDFRSGERTFQLLTQVAGRAGRSQLGGRVVLQSYSPLHYAIQAASRHHYHEFYDHELAFRRTHAYPPFAPLVRLVFSDPSARAAEEQSGLMGQRLRHRLAQLGLAGTEVLGPAPCFFGKLRGKYRWQLLVRGAHARELVRHLPPAFGWEVDVDPASTL